MKKNNLFKYLKYILYLFPLSLTITSCVPNNVKVSNTDIEYFQMNETHWEGKQMDTHIVDWLPLRTLYMGNYDNKWLNFDVGGYYTDQITIINSPKELEHHFENQYFVFSSRSSEKDSEKRIEHKYKFWDEYFVSPQKITFFKSKYNEKFFKTKILVINAGWSNKPYLQVPKIKNSDQKMKKTDFYEKLIVKNSFSTPWVNEHYHTSQTAHFYELIKKEQFEE